MLTPAMLVALAATPKPGAMPLRASCPAVPAVTVTTLARACPALEVSGSVSSGELKLDPAFSVDIPPVQLARPGAGDALLTGYAADGRTLFTLPVAAAGAFHLYVPLSDTLAESLQRLHLAAAGSAVDRVASPHGEPEAEVISLDDDHVLVAWDARRFPAVRVESAPGAAPFAFGGGSGTFQELTVATKARAVIIEFSDGVRSATRAFRVFGR